MIFQFRFEPILRQRLTQRDAASLTLANTQQQIDQTNTQIAQLNQQRKQLRGNQVRTGRISVASLQSADQHDAFLQRELDRLTIRLVDLNSIRKEQQSDLVAAQQEVKKLENLREKDRTIWQKDQQQRDQQQCDDQSNAAHYLTNRSTTATSITGN